MRDIPRTVAALISALQFQESDRAALRHLNDAEWSELFRRWEVSRLLVPLSQRFPNDIPPWVMDQVADNLRDNAERFRRIKAIYAAFCDGMCKRGGEHLVVKGFALWPDFLEHPRFRLQSDVDVYCPSASVPLAMDSLFELGYHPIEGMNTSIADHAPTMISSAPWAWRGNPYDPEIPVSFEVHFRFWNERKSRLRIQGLEEFWSRRIERRVDDLSFLSLISQDNLAYLSLSTLRDVLCGSDPPVHLLYSMAQFLQTNAGNEPFWLEWRALHHGSLRRLESISFRLAAQCFGCQIPEALQDEIARQPRLIQVWFDEFKATPVRTQYRHNKEALWLHIAALDSPSDRRAVFWKCLFPTRIPPANAPYIAKAADPSNKASSVLRKRCRHLVYLAKRAKYHLGILPRTLWQGMRFAWAGTGWNADFLGFLAASLFYNIGMYIFFFLYNLYLVDRGYKENFVGTVASAAMLGGVVGTLPAGLVVQRCGLKKALFFCLALVSLISALRCVFVSPLPLISLAFLAGAASVVWAVALSPAIAQFTSQTNRTAGFSVIVFFGIGLGVLGGFLGGRLPQAIVRLHAASTAAGSKEAALLISCVIAALGLIPLSMLRFTSRAETSSRTFTLTPFLFRFLLAIGIWSAVIGAFTPFFSLYFSRYWRMPLRQIGTIDSISHIPQMIAVVAAPIVFKKFGLINGAVMTQIFTALGLAALAYASGPSTATIVYVIYIAFQWMSEPAIFSLLMNNVEPHERAGASALNFLVVNLTQSVATFAAGSAFLRFGYPAVLRLTAGAAVVAALSFRLLLGKEAVGRAPSSQPSFEA